MRKKRMYLKKRRSKAFKVGLLTVLFVVGFVYSLYWLSKMSLPMSNEAFLKELIYHSNHNIPYNYERRSVVTSVIKFFSNVNLENPTTILSKSYKGLVTSPFDDGDDVVPSGQQDSDYIKDPYPEKPSTTDPLIYIYNTHQRESYKADHLAEYNITPNVMMASYILREKLGNLGLPAMVETTDVTEFLNVNNWNYASSYRVTKMLLEDAIDKNESLKYFVDVHRDSATRNITYKEIAGKGYARILFIVGLENKNYKANLAWTEKINQYLEDHYPGISRGIYKKEGPGVDGVYNQDISSRVILAEMGGVDNTIDEVLNSSTALAEALAECIKEDQ